MGKSVLALAVTLLASACLNMAPRGSDPLSNRKGTNNSGGSNGATNNSGGAAAGVCAPLPAPTGNVIEVSPSQASDLVTIVANAPAGSTILLRDGTYAITGNLVISSPNISFRSKSGDREAVIIDGGYNVNEPVGIQASNVTVADLTIQRAEYHPIHVQPGSGNVTGTLIHNVHIIDPKEQAIKINANIGYTLFTDYGEVRCSKMELTAAGRPGVHPYAGGCYTGGVDMHRSRGWTIHDNVIEGFWCPNGLAEHGIHVWTGSRDTQIFRNYLKDNARGIGLGLGENFAGRTYTDNPCGGKTQIGHFGGLIANNFIVTTDSNVGFDTGIGLEQVCDVQVIHNTIASVVQPYSAIEYRFFNTNAVIANNLVTHNLRQRDNAQATLVSNIENAALRTFFIAPSTGNFHLLPNAPAVDAGSDAYLSAVPSDFDQQARDAHPDVGADER